MKSLPPVFIRFAAYVLFALGPVFAATANAAVVALDGDALSLVVAYHTTPENRAALREELQTAGVAQFAGWKHDGVIKSYQLLFNRYADSANWDAMALLTFAHAADVERWTRIERSHTAGLTQRALQLTTAIDTVPVDLVRARHAATAATDPVFLVIPYQVLVSPDEYLQYADGYTQPQFEGWIDEGVLSGFSLYLSRYPAGRPWSSLIVLEYRSEATLAERLAVVAKVRARLRNNPQWKAISDNKKSVREEKQVVVADAIKPQAAPR
jgi:hypothetical protein